MVLTADEVTSWPRGMVDVLVDSGILRETTPARHVTCDECFDKHVESVEEQRTPGGAVRMYVFCAQAGRVPIEPTRLRQWVIRCDGLARAVAKALSATGDVETLVGDCVWRLGTITADERSFSAILARLDRVSDGRHPWAAAPSVACDKTVLLTLGAHDEAAVIPPPLRDDL